ncbi:Glutathione S-transferase, unnamed subgroup [Caballeronia glathei]|uniref:Glutathione S-transferase n=1 Tax=Caballeronia glathei TaxID=60547 RepID=A0A069PQL8_9BURK|nr:glutathione S-transferase [Caballeronia glathei]KDR42712.1 glutathione S-transferase [Caballeronia glathei]CDY75166.1 Glutathione S-transferase, unnamed subgroup [Caballeronia glathei]
MKLYYHPLSGHSHRARLFLSLIDAPYEAIEVDLAAGAHKSPEYLRMNRFGQVPVLVDGDAVISDSNAILVYLAKKHGKDEWLPQTPAAAAAVQRWLSVAAGEIAYGPAAARLVTVFNAKLDADDAIRRAHAVLKVIDDELAGREWIAEGSPTIADVALYGYIARAPEGNVDIAAYRNVNAWLHRVEALSGFVEFRKTPVGLTANS